MTIYMKAKLIENNHLRLNTKKNEPFDCCLGFAYSKGYICQRF